MANKQMNQLSTISEVAASDLMLIYDISEAGSEKAKSILYSDFESSIKTISEGDSFITITDAGTGQITGDIDGNPWIEINAGYMDFGDLTNYKAELYLDIDNSYAQLYADGYFVEVNKGSGHITIKTDNGNDIVLTSIASGPSLKCAVDNQIGLYLDGVGAVNTQTLGGTGGSEERLKVDQVANTIESIIAGTAEMQVSAGGVDVVNALTAGTIDASVLGLLERSSDPTEPTEGEAVIWMSDGSGKGDDGDVMIASKAGGVTNYGTLFDHSTGAAW